MKEAAYGIYPLLVHLGFFRDST